MKVYVAGLVHETNSFSPLPTTLRSFEEGLLHREGDAATAGRVRNFTGYGDALKIAARRGDVAVEGPFAIAQPAGVVPRPVYEQLRDALLDGLRAAMPVDFVFLMLHGAMVADGIDDCEGELLQRVHALVGQAVPVGALLDLHTNASSAMVDGGTVLVACKEYPHTDFGARAEELYAVLADVAAGRAEPPRTLLLKVPMLGLFGTTEPPMRDFVQRLKDAEREPGIVAVSAFHSFPWSDTPHTGAAIAVVHRDAARAARLAAALADEFLTQRAGIVKRLPLDEALDLALAQRSPKGPVVVADGSDNPGGGAACDSTFVLRAMLERGVTSAALGMVWDPLAASIAADAGVGARLPLRIGGKVGPMSGAPVDATVEVLAVRRDAVQRYLDGEGAEPLGLTVAVRIDGIDVVVNSIRQQVFAPDCFTEVGIDPASKAIVVVKSTQHFRAGFDSIAGSVVYCDAPGSLNGDLAALPYKRIARPVWPLDAV